MKTKTKAPRRKKIVAKRKPGVKKTAPEPAVRTPIFGLNSLTAPKGANIKKKLKGRGTSSGHGKTSTRGSKGQTSRSGKHFYIGLNGGQTPLIRRFPKRGFTSKFRVDYAVVNLERLKKLKETVLNPELLIKKGIVKNAGKPIKILSEGEIKEAKTFQFHAFSRKAAEKIENAGGKLEVLA